MEKMCWKPSVQQGGGFFNLNGTRTVYMCCCPFPYRTCGTERVNQLCLHTIHDRLKQLPRFVTTSMAITALQEVRRDLIANADEPEKCQAALAPAQPISPCGQEAGFAQSLRRKDLNCEMLTWRWEELGKGDENTFKNSGCPFVAKDKALDDTRQNMHKSFFHVKFPKKRRQRAQDSSFAS
eukprot:gnl/TRDRNA2_/TRDRNA2_166832_c0_seq2.p1 gnl/TRDRNA2_/TRDRNA2_166832_c0~~gnl/TRDRNA2_/TRDRNA2_166832_c0_seq2.p1  ORF type:complete len:181 (+),score=22.05 gnl/TRDRNA2_/TRDRNA2_166832_c0_seq2:256-798(+)